MPVKTQVAYNCADEALAHPLVRQRFDEVLAIIDDWVVPSYPGKSDYQAEIDLVHPILNAVAEYWLKTMGWQTQGVVKVLTQGRESEKGTIDFYLKLPDGRYILIEVQFGNGGRLERDFSKLQKLHKHGLLALGVLVYFDRATSKTADSGVCIFETAVSRLDELNGVPACVVGVSREGAEVADLRQLQGIVFPSILGGEGEGSGALHEFVAQALIERRPLAQVRLPKKLQDVVANHAETYLGKELASMRTTVARAAACQDSQLRAKLMAPIIEFARSSYRPESEQEKKSRVRQEALASLRQDLSESQVDSSRGAAPEQTTAPAPLACVPALCEASCSGQSEPVQPSARASAPRLIRVPRAQVEREAAAKTARRPPLAVVAPSPRGPVQHFAMAGAFQRAFAAAA